MYKKFSISIYALALFFSSFIAACLSPLIYNFPLLLCNDALRKNGECMFTSGEGFYYGAIVLYLFYFMQYCFHSCKNKHYVIPEPLFHIVAGYSFATSPELARHY